MSVIEIIKLGRVYLLTWPERKELARYFSEYRSIQISRLVYRYLPAVALVTFISQIYFGSISILPQALVYFFFIVSLPIQALIVLGLKADQFLPPGLSSWYKEGVAKINESGGDIQLSLNKPRFMDLARLLKFTYKMQTH